MAPSLPGPVAGDLLAEVYRLRSQLVSLVAEVDAVMAVCAVFRNGRRRSCNWV